MASRQEEGIRFLESTLADWLQGKWLAVHNSWHLALFLIELGRGAEVLAKYDTFIAPKIGDDALLDLVDAAALLWRLEIAGVDVGSRWQAISDQWLQHADDHVLVFNDLHIALAASRAGNADGLARLLASLDAYILDGQGDNAEISADVGRRLMRGVAAFGTGDYARAVELLLPVRYKWIRIGGSHAQRDLLIQTVIEAARRSGQAALARALLNERLAWRPTPRSRRLLAQAA
jgi:hypothetical protein